MKNRLQKLFERRNGMDEKPQKVIVDVPGTIAHTIGTVAASMIMVGVLTCFVALLFAPKMEVMIEGALINGSDGLPISFQEQEEVYRKMPMIRVFLWLIAIATWIFLIWL